MDNYNNIRIGMVSLGCSKNQVDAEHMLWLLRDAGFELCPDAGLCDAVIINTCGFIESAKQESIDNIMEFVTLKQEGRIKVLCVTGCLAERYREEVRREIPELDVILGIGSNAYIVQAIADALESGVETTGFGEKENLALDTGGQRIISNLPFYAYLKIADGCDNKCSYCAIPMIRGRFRSREMESVIAEAEHLAEHGVTELCLIAQDTTRYGDDLYGEYRLPELLQRLCRIEKLRWIRVLYCYPERVTDELLDVMAREDKIVKYMDLPIQHVHERILRAMNRRGNAQALRSLIEKIRVKIPGITLRTTLITGFPGESDAEFEELCDFVREVRFERLGCFAFSREEDTPAYAMPMQIDPDTASRRAEIIMEIQMEISAQHNAAMIGKAITVVCEGFDRYAESWFGRSVMDAPDIDGKVFFTAKDKIQIGDYVDVRITESMDYDLIGKLVTQ